MSKPNWKQKHVTFLVNSTAVSSSTMSSDACLLLYCGLEESLGECQWFLRFLQSIFCLPRKNSFYFKRKETSHFKLNGWLQITVTELCFMPTTQS